MRTGYTEALTGVSKEEQSKKTSKHQSVGIEGTEEVAKWFWNQHFSAVAGDQVGFEVLPPQANGEDVSFDQLGEAETVLLLRSRLSV